MLQKKIILCLCCALLLVSLFPTGVVGSALAVDGAYTSGQTYDKYPALKDVYKDYFTLGCFGAGEINALIYNYASFSPGNSMKPAYTQPNKGGFSYDGVAKDFAQYTSKNPDIILYGHTLAWHSQSPAWMWDAPPSKYEQPGTYDKDTALANLNSHIENVLGRFGGQLAGIDVVNEAVGTSKPGDWKASLEKGEGWYMALGWEWVELAFVKAAEVVDKNGWDCKLIYNDFGLDSPQKARVVYEMVKDINERYDGVRPNGKKLIEVIGMQAHYSLTTDVASVEESIKLFATLPGVGINITEMDIGCPPTGTLSSKNESNQAMKFAELFSIYKKYATGSANTTDNPKVIDRVSICGVRDATTGWRAGEFALLFNSDGRAKQALTAVLDPDAFLAAHDYMQPEGQQNTATVPGVHVSDMGRGDTWSGANIIMGSDANEWPWSEPGEDGKVAFTPEKDATYRLSFNYTATGTTGIRVRWITDNTNGSYTIADGAVVNNYVYTSKQTGTTIPALFNGDMVNMGSYTLTTEFKMSGTEKADGLIGNIAIRGHMGGNAFTINWIKVEKVGGGVLVDWDASAASTSELSSDLDSAHEWAHTGIQSAISKGFVPQDLQSKYMDVISRAEFCRMAIKWLEYKTGKNIDALLAEKSLIRDTTAFTDTSDPDILAAYALGITNGTKAPTAAVPGTFAPNGDFNREQAATMIRNTCKAAGIDIGNVAPAGFTDISAASSWAVDSIHFCYANGIMNGTNTSPMLFDPKRSYSREQSIVTFDNMK